MKKDRKDNFERGLKLLFQAQDSHRAALRTQTEKEKLALALQFGHETDNPVKRKLFSDASVKNVGSSPPPEATVK